MKCSEGDPVGNEIKELEWESDLKHTKKNKSKKKFDLQTRNMPSDNKLCFYDCTSVPYATYPFQSPVFFPLIDWSDKIMFKSLSHERGA